MVFLRQHLPQGLEVLLGDVEPPEHHLEPEEAHWEVLVGTGGLRAYGDLRQHSQHLQRARHLGLAGPACIPTGFLRAVLRIVGLLRRRRHSRRRGTRRALRLPVVAEGGVLLPRLHALPAEGVGRAREQGRREEPPLALQEPRGGLGPGDPLLCKLFAQRVQILLVQERELVRGRGRPRDEVPALPARRGLRGSAPALGRFGAAGSAGRLLS
mmetsp:Transcript_25560/g.73442  ORF Transcript_25560/g.73442 Transcript_25560/m.73442 type:complete len:212 (-) Transcript_25560:721-1356(-)